MSKVSHLFIQNFGPIDELELYPKQINVLVGRNNAGKSSILRAIDIAMSSNIEDFGYENDFPFSREARRFIKSGKNVATVQVNEDKICIFRDIASIPNKMRNKILSKLSQELDILYKDVPEDKKHDLINYYLSKFDFTIIISKNGVSFYPYPKEKNYIPKDYLDHFVKTIYGRDAEIKKGNQAYRLFNILSHIYGPLSQRKIKSSVNVQYVSHHNKIDEPEFTSNEAELIKIEEFIKENSLVENLQRLTKDYVIYTKGADSAEDYEMIPYRMHGDGFISLLNILHYLLRAKDGILLIEEPENHLHPQYVEVFVETIFKYCNKLNVQVFMASHSYDVIQRIVEYPKTNEDIQSVQLVRLQRDGGLIEPKIFSVERSKNLLNELGLDLRGF
jgi:AAA15 family ATPase/GTPase